jgi:hypothetical protein
MHTKIYKVKNTHKITMYGGEKMEFVIEALEEVTPKHPCSSKPFKALPPSQPIGIWLS